MRLLLSFMLLLGIQLASAQPAQFSISTIGTNPQIDSAIQYTADIWSRYLNSPVPIKVNIRYGPLLGALGISFPNGVKNFPNAPETDTWYPTCMANAMVGYELNPGEHDMDIYIDSARNWYFGTDGNPGLGQTDFVSVLLHEICHSLGIISLAKVQSGIGSFGRLRHIDFFFLPTTFGFFDQDGLPSAYDRFLMDQNGASLIDPVIYDSNSLVTALTSNQLFLQTDSIRKLTGDTIARVYAPAGFQLGSSITHFDENTYNGTANALMTPSIGANQVEHDPGPLLQALLYDLGWKYSGQFVSIDERGKREQLRIYPNPLDEVLFIDHIGTDVHHICIYTVDGRKVKDVRVESSEMTELRLENFPSGSYVLELIGAAGIERRSLRKR